MVVLMSKLRVFRQSLITKVINLVIILTTCNVCVCVYIRLDVNTYWNSIQDDSYITV